MIVSGYPGVFGENRNKLVNEWVGDLVYEVAISTEVIFRAHRILVRRTEVYFRGNNLIYWFVHTEVQLPCGLTALAGYRYGSFKTVRIAINWIVNFSSGRLISASLLDYDTVYEHPGAAAMQIDKGFWCSTYTKLYKSGGVPILDYCTSVWGYNVLDKIDTIQNRAIRLCPQVFRKSGINVVMGSISCRHVNDAQAMELIGYNGWQPACEKYI